MVEESTTDSDVMASIEKRWRILALVSIGWFLVVGTRFILPAVLPRLTVEFSLSNTTAGLALTLSAAAYAAVQLPAGLVADRFGERHILGVSLFVLLMGVLFIGIASSVYSFLVGCVVLGLGGGLYGPPQGSLLSRIFVEGDGAAFGLSRSAGSTGAAILPMGAGLILPLAGWRGAFAVVMPALLLMSVGLWWSIPPTTGTVVQRNKKSSTSLREVVAVLGKPPVAIAVIATTLMVFVFQALTAFLPLYLNTVKGMSEVTAASLYAIFFGSGAVFQLIAGRLGDRYGFKRALVGVALLGVLPLAALPSISGQIAIGLTLVVAGTRLGLAPLSDAYIVRILPDEIQGGSWGLIRTVFFVFGSAGPLTIGWMADIGYFDQAFVALGALSGLTAALYWRLPKRDAGLKV